MVTVELCLYVCLSGSERNSPPKSVSASQVTRFDPGLRGGGGEQRQSRWRQTSVPASDREAQRNPRNRRRRACPGNYVEVTAIPTKAMARHVTGHHSSGTEASVHLRLGLSALRSTEKDWRFGANLSVTLDLLKHVTISFWCLPFMFRLRLRSERLRHQRGGLPAPA